MSLKDIQVFNHRHYKLIRNICLGIILLAIFVLPGILQLQRLDRQAAKIDAQTAQIKAQTAIIESLTRDNKQLNIRLDQKTDDVQKSINCVGIVFAQFTHDNVPIDIANLKRCIITTGTSGDTSAKTSSSSVGQPASSNPSSVNNRDSLSSSNSSTPNSPSQPKILPLDCKVDVLFVHLGCP